MFAGPVVAFLLLAASPVFADTYAGPELPLITSLSGQSHPDICAYTWTLRVVWQDDRNGLPDIYLAEHSLIPGKSGKVVQKPVYVGPFSQQNPRVFGNYVVWEDNRSGNWDIYGKNLKSGAEIAVCTAPGDQVNPEITGTYVVWEDYRGGNWDIYLKNLNPKGDYFTAETAVCTNSAQQQRPDVWCKNPAGTTCPELYVVWDDTRSGTSADIWWKDMISGTETRVSTPAGSNEYNPRIFGDMVLWDDHRSGNWDIYARHFEALTWDSEHAIVTGSSDQLLSDFYEDRYVWQDYRSGAADIYFAVAEGSERLVTDAAGDQQEVSLSDHSIVWADYRSGNGDIYLGETVSDIPAGLPLTTKPAPLFSWSPASPKAGRTLGMIDKTDPGGLKKDFFYYWDFDGDNKPDSNLFAPLTRFTTPGKKTVRLTIGTGARGAEEPTKITKTKVMRIPVS